MKFQFTQLAVIFVLVFTNFNCWGAECENWQSTHPEWIFCDDFESTLPLVGAGRYFEYNDNNGNFVVTNSAGFLNSRGIKTQWSTGQVAAGNISVGFGRNPSGYMNKGIRSSEDFTEIYYRMYLKNDLGWAGSPAKLSRATVITDSSWSQAMIAHLWSDGQNHLLIDPAGCINNSSVMCEGYNDFNNLNWLGKQSGPTEIFSTELSDQWFCIEAHVKLNSA